MFPRFYFCYLPPRGGRIRPCRSRKESPDKVLLSRFIGNLGHSRCFAMPFAHVKIFKQLSVRKGPVSNGKVNYKQLI